MGDSVHPISYSTPSTMLRQSTSRLVARTCRQQHQQPFQLARTFATSRPARDILGEGNAELFKQHAVEGKRLTIVDFHADWCPPCKMLDPILQKALKDEPEADLLKINTDTEVEIAAKYKVSALPTVIAFMHGKELCRFVGLVNEEAVHNFVTNAKDH